MRYAIVVVALLAAACSPDTQPAIPTPQPPRGAPSRLELTAVPGTGQTGGTAAISARVQDAYGATLPGVVVAFSSTAGTFTATPVQTSFDGVARTTLVAIAGVVQVSAQAGTVTSTPLPVAVQPHSDPLPPTPPTPNPSPPDRGPAAPLTVALTVGATTLGTPSSFLASVAGGAPQRLSWTFGDGARDEGLSTSTGHLYAAIGSYQASVTVQDEFDRTASASAVAVVGAPAPTPSPSPSPQPPANTPRYDVTISISPSLAHVGDPVTVTANINPQFTPPPVASITFGCGGLGATDPPPSLATSATCKYTRQGDVTISVTVTDGGSTTATATKQLTVQQ